jgi:hypothetical protein
MGFKNIIIMSANEYTIKGIKYNINIIDTIINKLDKNIIFIQTSKSIYSLNLYLIKIFKSNDKNLNTDFIVKNKYKDRIYNYKLKIDINIYDNNSYRKIKFENIYINKFINN